MHLDSETSSSVVTDYGFVEKIKITEDICPGFIKLITSRRQFIVYSNFKEKWGVNYGDKSIYSFEYIRNFERDICRVEFESTHGEVIVRGSFTGE